MAELSSDTVLQRAPHLNVELGPSTIIVKIWMYGNGVQVKAGHKLKVSYKYRVDSPGTSIEIVRS